MPRIATVRGMGFSKITGARGECKGYVNAMWRREAVDRRLVVVPKRGRAQADYSPDFAEWVARNTLEVKLRAYTMLGGWVVEFRFPDAHTATAFKMRWM